VGAQYYTKRFENVDALGQQFPAPVVRSVGGAAVSFANEDIIENKTFGLYIQEQLSFNNRVFLTAAVRGDDNSAFGENYNAVIYPKLSASWVVNEEPFWKLAAVNSLKLRGAWGMAGQQPDVFAAIRLYDPATGPGDGSVLTPQTIGNPDLAPERGEELELGFDMVIHSATKYLNGHSDMVGGVAIVGENKELADQMQFLQNAVGAIAGPFDSFLALRGLKTLALRMERHSENAYEIAHSLHGEPKIKAIFYPGLETHPQHELAKRQMRGFGGMVTLVLNTDLEGTRRFLENTHLFSLAESLGGVESLVNHPALMTHGSIPLETRLALGITDSLVRLSVGVEDVEDLKDDLRTALAAI
jgi:hypothetical protein